MDGITIDSQYTAGVTIKIAVADTVIDTDVAAYLAAIQPSTGDWSGYSATSILVYVVTNPIYYAFGADPVTDGSVGNPLSVDDSILIKGWQNIKNLRFIRQGSNTGAIMLTPFFNDVG